MNNGKVLVLGIGGQRVGDHTSCPNKALERFPRWLQTPLSARVAPVDRVGIGSPFLPMEF